MCLQCFIFNNNQNGCIQCGKVQKIDTLSKKESTNDDFNDFDESQLFDDWNEHESPSQNDSKQTDMDFMNSVYDDETEEGDDSDEENPVDNNQHTYKVQWLSHIKDDAAEFSSDHTYPHTKTLFDIFDTIFGLKQV
jgi:hypothetical protein